MKPNETLILRAALEGKTSIYRDIEIEGFKSLYKLAEAIVTAFCFDFDHAFWLLQRVHAGEDARPSPV